MTRASDRKGFDHDTRVTLLEGDADSIDSKVIGLEKSMQRVSSSLIGATITLGTSALLLAANLIILG